MSAVARAKILDLVTAITPTERPQHRFRALGDARGAHKELDEHLGQSRIFALTSTDEPRDLHREGSGPPGLFAQQLGLEVLYSAQAPLDFEQLDRMRAADSVAIVQTLQTPSNWSGLGADLDQLVGPTQAGRRDVVANGRKVGEVVSWDLQIQFYPGG